MVLPATETLIPVGQAINARIGDVVPDQATIWRWRTSGVNGAVLECTRLGRKWYTSLAAVERFLAAQNQTPPAKQDGSRTADTARKLQAAGLLKQEA